MTEAYVMPNPQQPLERDADVWWVVTLREEGDDEDSLIIIKSANEEEAIHHAKLAFYDDNDSTGTPTIYINHVVRCGSVEPEHVRTAP